MTDEQHGHYIRALMMADRLIDDGPEKRDWRLSFGRLFEGRRESPIPEDVGTEVESVLRSRIEAARRAINCALTQNSRRSLDAALAVLGGDDTRVNLRLPESQLHPSEPPLNRSEPGLEPSLNRLEPGVVQGAFLPQKSLRQLLEALEVGAAAAHEVAARYHQEMAGYLPKVHEQMDAEAQQVKAALDEMRSTIKSLDADHVVTDDTVGLMMPMPAARSVQIGLRLGLEAARRDVDRRPSDDTRLAVTKIEAVKAVMDKLVAAIDLDRAIATASAANAQVRQAQAALDELRNGSRREDIAQGEAALRAAQAQAQVQSVTLDKLTVTAPRDGRVDALPYRLGDQAPVGAPLAVLLVGDAPYARIYVPEPIRANVKVGDKVQVFVGGRDGALAGSVRMIRSEPSFTPYYALIGEDAARLSYLAEVSLDSGAAQLPAGLPVRVEFDGE